MKILQVNKKVPFPLHDGESIAVTSMATGLKEAGADIHLFALNTLKHFYSGNGQDLMTQLDQYNSITLATIDTAYRLLPAFADLFTPAKCYHIDRFYNSKVSSKLSFLLRNNTFDIVQLESAFVLPYLDTIRKYHHGIVALRAHNAEYEIWKRLAEHKKNWIVKFYFEVLAKKLARYETSLLKKIDLLLPVSKEDDQKFSLMGFHRESLVCPIGIVQPGLSGLKTNDRQEFRIGFIGSMDWRPNKEGIEWFVKNVIPRLKKIDGHDFMFTIAGRKSSELARSIQDATITVAGEVDSSTDFLTQMDVLVVPIWSGSGMRVKIIEAFSVGTPVITTGMGIEGIPAVDGQHFLLANTAQEFVHAITRLRESPDLRKLIIGNAFSMTQSTFDPLKAGKSLINKYVSMLEKMPK